MLKSIALCRRSLTNLPNRGQAVKVTSKRPLSAKSSSSLLGCFSRAQRHPLHPIGCRSCTTSVPPSEMNDMPHLADDSMDHESDLVNESSDLDGGIPSLGPGSAPLLPTDTNTKQTMQSAKPAYQPLRNKPTAPQRFNVAQANAPGTFVSSYYKMDESNLISYLNRKNIAFKQNSSRQIVVRDCPFCHDTKAHPTNLWKLYIYMENGNYFCFRCSSQGSWCVLVLKLKRALFMIVQRFTDPSLPLPQVRLPTPPR